MGRDGTNKILDCNAGRWGYSHKGRDRTGTTRSSLRMYDVGDIVTSGGKEKGQ